MGTSIAGAIIHQRDDMDLSQQTGWEASKSRVVLIISQWFPMKLAISSHLRVGKTGDIGASTEAKTNKHWIFFHHPQSSHVSTRVVFHRFSIESEAKVPKTWWRPKMLQPAQRRINSDRRCLLRQTHSACWLIYSHFKNERDIYIYIYIQPTGLGSSQVGRIWDDEPWEHIS